MDTNIDIHQLKDNALYLVKSVYNREDTEKIINYLNANAEFIGLKTRFVWFPDGISFEQFIAKEE